MNGRTKIAIRNVISDYIPNPTFEVVAQPGAQEEYFKEGNKDGKSHREILGKPMKAIPAFRDPVARTRADERDGPAGRPDVADPCQPARRAARRRRARHARRRSTRSTSGCSTTGRSTTRTASSRRRSSISASSKRRIEELEYVVENGARVILIRPAPVNGLFGKRSMALPEFDPFWAKVAEADILVGLHASDSGYQRYVNEWEGVRDGEMLPFKGRSAFGQIMGHFSRPVVDTIISLIAHGLCTRFPTLRFAPVENGSDWVRPVLEALEHGYDFSPTDFEEHPVEVFKRNIYVHPFHEEDTAGLVRLLGRRPRDLRFGLAAPRGPRRPDQLRRRAQGHAGCGCPRGDGRQPRPPAARRVTTAQYGRRGVACATPLLRDLEEPAEVLADDVRHALFGEGGDRHGGITGAG